MELPPLFDALDVDAAVASGFPDIHEAYRMLRDQKDMVCGAYALTYLLWRFGVTERDGEPVTVDQVAEAAGTVLEPRNADALTRVEQQVKDGYIPQKRAGGWTMHDHFGVDWVETADMGPESTWTMHDHFGVDLTIVDDEGGTSAEGVEAACHEMSGGLVEAVPVPAVTDDAVQLDADCFVILIDGSIAGRLPAQPILNYNSSKTLAPVGSLDHKYNLVSTLTQWDEPSYFRKHDWDVGRFTALAARVMRGDCDERFLLVRDSYRSFGWNGYHLQSESYLRRGVVRADDHCDGGVVLVMRATDTDTVLSWLADYDLTTGLWDNGSAYAEGS